MELEQVLQELQSRRMTPQQARQALERSTNASDVERRQDGSSEANSASLNRPAVDAIAIVGMSGRYPDAPTLSLFWENLQQGRSSIREIPSSRWDTSLNYDPRLLQDGKIYCKWMGALDDIDSFDPRFFGLAPSQAEMMDPQQRLFLQEAYRAIEDAGYNPRSLSGAKCGVYLGMMSNEYGFLLQKAGAGGGDGTGNSSAISAARIAYYLNLKGPAIAIDTACSSSLVATHLACQALRCGEVDLALAGGVSLYLAPEAYVTMCSAGMLSPEGMCRTFDDGANGFVPGEGVGVLVLKRLKDAEADGDHIWGVVIGSGINQDGKSNGITAPGGQSQMDLAREVYDRYGIDPESIGYVEMHGTGTKLGDPVELQSLASVFREKTSREGFCAIGSVKTNIGHTSAAAGVAGVHKAVLSLKHEALAPSLNYRVPNRHFNFEGSPFFVSTALRPWQAGPGVRRRAAVSSFGFSGTNAHLVLQEYESGHTSHRLNNPSDGEKVYVISAATESQLHEQASRVASHLEVERTLDLTQVAYTLQVGREALKHRLAILADSRARLISRLRTFSGGGADEHCLTGCVEQRDGDLTLLEDDEDGDTLLCSWFEKSKLRKLASVWVRGMKIDWGELYRADRPRRVALPTYPFIQQRYWIPEPAEQSQVKDVVVHASADMRVFERLDVGKSAATARVLKPHWAPVLPLRTSRKRVSAGRVVAVGGSESDHAALARISDSLSVLTVTDDSTTEDVANQLGGAPMDHLCWIETREPTSPAHPESRNPCARVRTVFRVIKAVLQLGYAVKPMRWTVVTVNGYALHEGEVVRPEQAAIHGLVGAMAKEFPSWEVSLVDVDSRSAHPWSDALALPEDPQGNAWLYRRESWYRQRLSVVDQNDNDAARTAYRKGGVYVVIGGAGAVGENWSEWVIRHYEAQVVWIGRRASDASIRAKLQRLAALGPAPLYIQADARDRQGLEHAYTQIKNRFGRIHGVIHAAIVLQDQSLLNMDEPRFMAAFTTKAEVCGIVSHVFGRETLDFILFFSSLQSFIKAAGQSNYAAGCAFSDAFACDLERRQPGRVKIANWGYWGAGGATATVSPTHLERFAASGIAEIDPAQAMRFVEQLICGSELQLAYVQTSDAAVVIDEIGEVARERSDAISAGIPSTPLDVDERALQEYIASAIEKALAAVLKLPVGTVDPDLAFFDCGVDSINSVRIVTALNQMLNLQLPATTLFDFSTSTRLAAHLFAEHRSQIVASLHGIATTAQVQEERLPPLQETAPRVSRDQGGNLLPVKDGNFEVQRPADREPIAIIGMSGRFPGSPTLDHLWEHLGAGHELLGSTDRWTNHSDLISGEDRRAAVDCYGGFLDDVALFDPLFFNISGTEALCMDPQQRLFLEEAWNALENAGYGGQGMRGTRCGVYVGCRASEYSQLLMPPVPVQAMWGNSSATLASRISYHLDLHGPAISVDTACSSSLVAVHLACQGLWSRETQMAIAGGVNVQCTADLQESGSRAGMLSRSGHCHTFDERADGFIASEGVGVVVLKRLQDAIDDRDHIWAVINGSGINQDGASNGITAPNALAQEQLENEIYERFGIRPDDIDMVEAHGTGTVLGDPIEVQALTRAFRRHTQRVGYCALGSIKTNIGHAITASGVAGLLKVLLSLQHRQIPPTINYRRPNPNINFDATPFFVNASLREWNSREGKKRCAAISSFGLSGTNAHVVVEEGPPSRPTHRHHPAYLITLSAQTHRQLRELVQRLIAHCQRHPQIDCGDMSYTLFIGRRHREIRLACTAITIADLVERLSTWLADERVPGVHFSQGEISASSGTSAAIQGVAVPESTQSTEEFRQAVEQFADLYVRGEDALIGRLFEQDRYRRIPLPTYPFARKRYWPAAAIPVGRTARSALHPLLHENTSRLTEHRFSSVFYRNTPLLSHHAGGESLLPGSAYLEMARAAVERMTETGGAPILLRNVVWLQPLKVATHPVRVHVAVTTVANEGIRFCIYTDTATESATDLGKVTHCEGWAAIGGVHEVADIDLRTLQGQCTQGAYSGSDCYEALQSVGVHVEASHRCIAMAHVGDHQVLSQLEPPSTGTTLDGVALHPALVDAALQSVIALTLGTASEALSSTASTALLFAIDSAEILQGSKSAMWSWVRVTTAEKIDVDLFDEEGRACARLRGISSRRNTNSSALTAASETPPVGRLLLTPTWQVERLERVRAEPSTARSALIVGANDEQRQSLGRYYPVARYLPASDARTVQAMFCGLEADGSIDEVLWLVPVPTRDDGIDDERLLEQKEAVLTGFQLVKELLRICLGQRSLRLTVITVMGQPVHRSESVNPGHSAVHGLIGSVAKEYPSWRVRAVDLQSTGDWPIEEILALPNDPHGNAWCHRDGVWYRQRLVRCSLPSADGVSIRKGGVYVVIGGAGALGGVFSEYLIRQYAAQVVWVGRRAPDVEMRESIKRLSAMGPEPVYVRADAADRKSLELACKDIEARFGKIHGVVHSALVMAGSPLAQMDEGRFRAGLAAKVDTSIRIAQVFGPLQLDFLLFFSSIQSFEKTRGQANYAAGCAYSDAFAHELRQRGIASTKVINWGYWGSVGFASQSSGFRHWIAEAGMGSIEPQEGMAVLEQLLYGPVHQLAFLKTLRADAMQGVIFEERVAKVERMELPLVSVPPTENALPRTSVPGADQFDPVVAKLLYFELHKLGLFGGGEIDLAKWRKDIRLPALYERWVEESLRVLAERGYVTVDGGNYFSDGVEPASAWDEWRQLRPVWMSSPSLRGQVVLVETTLQSLQRILRGEIAATAVLFPMSSTKLVEDIYKTNEVADYFNEVIARTLLNYIAERRTHGVTAPLRILEVGAGTGATTRALIRALQSQADLIEEYRFTDISNAFVLDARDQEPQQKWLSFARYDVEAPAESQGIEASSFDVVIAANVLHATKDIRRTVENVKATLKRNGQLMMYEVTDRSLFAHLTFGLLKGWWLYEDTPLRIAGSPALSADTWRTVLHDAGFHTITFPAYHAREMGQQVIVAASDGINLRNNDGSAQNADTERYKPAKKIESRDAQRSDESISDDLLEQYVRQALLSTLAGILTVASTDIAATRPFADFGLDSIMAVRAVEVLNRDLAVALTTTSLFDFTTVDALTAHILDRHRAGLTKAVAGQLVQSSARSTEHFREDGRADAKPIGACSQLVESTLREPKHPATMREPIAVVGMSARYAGAETISDLWEYLQRGTELVEDVQRWTLSPSEWGIEGSGHQRVRGGLLRDISTFDPLFFNLSGIEATYMDPQQRIFLEEVWKALEDGGYAGQALSGGRVGVYAGCNGSDYQQLYAQQAPALAMWGSASSILSARIAYFLNLKGPAITVDTACSSSLVAVHLACQALWGGEIDAAIAGGVSVHCTPSFYAAGYRAGMLSATGHCFAFDDRADGFVPGEGAGVVLLKRLKDAVRDGDHIYGAIRGSGINQDGTTNGITAPSAASQESLECQVYERFDIRPEQIEMVEAHGTGTSLGDPIEFEALTRAFRRYTHQSGYCGLGSIKTNVGHTVAASGVAGLIKALLCLHRRKLVPTLNFERANSRIDLRGSPFYINTTLRDWNAKEGHKRCAAVSSFGLSGTNAHVVVEEAPALSVRPAQPRPTYLVALSGRTPDQLRQQVIELRDYCEQNPLTECGNISRTLLSGRRHLEHRFACVAKNIRELTQQLGAWLAGTLSPGAFVAHAQVRDRESRPALRRLGEQHLKACIEAADSQRYAEELATLGELHLQGCSFDFELLFDGERRISLPTYPFSRDTFWVGDPSADNFAGQSIGKPGSPVPARNETVEGNQGGGEPSALSLLRATEVYVRGIVSDTLRIPSNQIENDEPFESYGVDSILAGRLASAIQRDVPDVRSTLFYEYQSVNAVVGYLLEYQTQAVARLTHQSPPTAKGKAPEATAEVPGKGMDVAIIGMGGRFPLANDVAEYWENLREGRDCIQEIPKERWALDGFYCPDRVTAVRDGKSYCKWGGFVDPVDRFDPSFFGLTNAAAAILDPQERLFLETAWSAVEDAGYTRETLRRVHGGRVGVYVGAASQLYSWLAQSEGPQTLSGIGSYAAIANRVSFVFGLSGPSIAIDATCASSTFAIHQACKDLSLGECDVAIAGGVNLHVHPRRYKGLCQAGLLGSGAESRSFGIGDGFLPAEAIGAIVLKSLSRAIKDGDNILAVIRGTATGYGGRATGYSTPNPKAQARVIMDCIGRSSVDPGSISHVEAGASGSPIADALELVALSDAFDQSAIEPGSCHLGAVKSHIGHAEAASGITQLIKVVLELQHAQYVPAISSTTLDPELPPKARAFYFHRELQYWPRPSRVVDGQARECPRRALINSYGAGSYASLLVEEYTVAGENESMTLGDPEEQQLLVISGRTSERLRMQVGRLLGFVESHPDLRLCDLAYTLQVGREAMECRLAVVACNKEEFIEAVRAYLGDRDTVALSRVQTYVGPTVNVGTAESHGPPHPSPVTQTHQSLDELASQWVQGSGISWESLQRHQVPRKVSLPTYPFERVRCWIEPTIREYSEVAPPAASMQDRVASIWCSVLRIDHVGSEDNFFDLGGDSLMCARVMSQLSEQIGVELPATAIFEAPTLAELVRYIHADGVGSPSQLSDSPETVFERGVL